ncbi:diaminopimelate epimerase [Stackebrandtia soli]|uniref:diaminopimelate epimerase n=1 Tax=Stackebrandtia soli TaxID=1892856 RepID=UPI0039EA2EE4
MDFAKGHGTGNDFIVVADVDGRRPLTTAEIVALCDRRFGVGGDGVLRVIRTAAHPEGGGQDAEWFMDYYNADGSIAEMCGNGVRVFARYLLDEGLVTDDVFPVATRAGLRTVTVSGEDLTVDMDRPVFGGESKVTLGDRTLVGTHVSMGNPHLVCPVDDLDAIDLSREPVYDETLFPNAVNVEVYTGGPDAITMRVFERGVGETLSCGTGACAAAAVALGGNGTCVVTIPGGQVTVTVTTETLLLTGPAVIIAHGTTTIV